MKKIIIRIIVRIIVVVSVAFILSKFRVLGILNVNAAENVVKAPQNIITYDYQNNSYTGTLTQTTFMNSTYYVASFSTNYSQVNGFSFAMTKGSVLPGFLWDASFNFLQSGLASEQFRPVRAYIRDTNDNITYCEVSSSGVENNANNTSGSLWNTFNSLSTIHCQNVYIDSDFRVYILGDFSLSSGDVVGLSRANFVKLDGSSQYLQQIEQQTKETNDLLKDDTPVSDDSINSVLSSNDESNSPISDLVSMPLTLLQKINTGMNGSCSPFVLGSLLGTTLSLPCINLGSRLGTLWNIIDMCMSIFMAYTIGMMCIRIYNNFTTLKDNSNDVYGGDI